MAKRQFILRVTTRRGYEWNTEGDRQVELELPEGVDPTKVLQQLVPDLLAQALAESEQKIAELDAQKEQEVEAA